MPEERVERRLAAIFAGDVAGYSRLMGADEEGTLRQLKAHRKELVDLKITEHRGRIVKTTGDGMLAEFSSVVDAVRCAVEIQRGMLERNAEVPAETRIQYRIGINVGDIISDSNDIYGDGVNVAARLESLAEPGGILVSRNVYDQVRDKLSFGFEDLGEQAVKNIVRPVGVHRVQLDANATDNTAKSDPFSATSELSESRKPTLAVLPFANMSGDTEQEYFADGMAEDIITALSRLHWLIVMARTSSFEFKGRNLDVREIARRLGVRYVLEGSVRKAGDRVRISGQLIDATSGAHLWADRFDGDLADIFDLQDKITENVVGAIEPSLRWAEIERAKRKRPESLDAYDYYLRALPHFYASTKEGSADGMRLIDKAITLDPGFAPATALAAWFYFNRVNHGWSTNQDVDSAKGAALARAALEVDTDDPMALATAGWVLANLAHDLAAGAAAIDRAVALGPNSPHVLNLAGWIRTYIGDQRKALEPLQQALRLSPSDPLAYRFLTGAAVANLLMGRFEDAAKLGEEARGRNAKWGPILRTLAAAYAQLGQPDKAAEALSRLLEREPSATISHYCRQLPYRDPEQAERLWDGLRKAGLPE